MKNVIYWFSGTGNSLSVAMDLAKALGDTELIPIARIINRDIPSSEKMGVVFPVYAFGLPILVWRFLQRVPVINAKYIYTVATMGGLAGVVHRQARELLAKRGAALASGWSITMPGNYPVLKAPPTAEKQARIFEKAQRRVKEIAAQISAGATGIYEDTRAPLGWLLAPINKPAMNRFPESDSNFVVGKQCTHCALCAKVCPVENIRLAEGQPVWMHHCEQCMACLQWCPVQAIEYGSATAGKPRYHYPRFKASDLFLREE
ncbi:MAG: EFR1 family ferrodoxin [Kiritimatiellia bacterium]|nr:EFR1 family ferrodoxin [Kiritimatiellia bacterium]